MALRILLQFHTTIIIIDWKVLPFPSSLSILTPLKSWTTLSVQTLAKSGCQKITKSWVISNYSNALNIPREGPSKFQSPVWSSFVCLKHTCPSVWKRPEFVQCWFLSHTREGGENQQHVDGLDPDLGKVFLWEKTYDWRLSCHSSGAHREQEQGAPHPSNSHGSSLRKGWKQRWEQQSKIHLLILSWNSVIQNQTSCFWYHHSGFIGNKWFQLEWTPSLEMRAHMHSTYLKDCKKSIMPLKKFLIPHLISISMHINYWIWFTCVYLWNKQKLTIWRKYKCVVLLHFQW